MCVYFFEVFTTLANSGCKRSHPIPRPFWRQSFIFISFYFLFHEKHTSESQKSNTNTNGKFSVGTGSRCVEAILREKSRGEFSDLLCRRFTCAPSVCGSGVWVGKMRASNAPHSRDLTPDSRESCRIRITGDEKRERAQDRQKKRE